VRLARDEFEGFEEVLANAKQEILGTRVP
jgi:hypothetical protein